MPQGKVFETTWAGRKLTIEVGKLAQQANGSCRVQYGDTVILATAVMSKNIREGIDFFPLMVDYEEKLYAAGKIKGSRFIKRETRPSDEAVLTARMIDRSIRPLFPDAMRRDVQVMVTVMSVDGENDPDVPSLIGAVTALTISNIPWDGPIAAVRVGQINGEWVLNPSYEARLKSVIDVVVSGDGEKTIMLEAAGNEAPEQVAIDSIKFGQKHIGPVLDFIKDIGKQVGQKKLATVEAVSAEEKAALVEKEKVRDLVRQFVRENIHDFVLDQIKATKMLRKSSIADLKEACDHFLSEKEIGKDKRKDALGKMKDFIEEEVSRAILEDGKRVDGRGLTDIRPLEVMVGALPRTHGSAVFQRGETQVMSVVTLGAPGDEQVLEGIEENGKKRYMHHYNFPGFSVGEVSPSRGASRRDIGHGALAEKSIVPMLPPKETFPYTIRVVSEVLGSNGSSSMASVCGSTLSLMDAGVPISKPVAGIAMGLVSNAKGQFKILTDLQDLEDGDGGMDFKIAGTADGITAVQMDTKTTGLSMEIVEKTFKQAHEARLKLLKVMADVIAAPRPELSQYAPRIVTLTINPDKIRDVIGPGGKMINKIIDETGVDIDIEDSGLVFITAVNAEGSAKAVEWIKNLTREVKAGEVFTGKVTRIMDFGAFVEVLPNQEGLVHISQLAPHRVEKVTDVVKIGDEVQVKVTEIDEKGRINLSMKALQAPADGLPEYEAPRGGRRPFGGRGGDRGRR